MEQQHTVISIDKALLQRKCDVVKLLHSHLADKYEQAESKYEQAENKQELTENKQEIHQKAIAYISGWPNGLITSQIGAGGVLKQTATTLYYGSIANQMYHGYGLIIYIHPDHHAELRFYQGSFQNNCKHGYGMELINQDIFIGRFLNNKPEDQKGLFIWGNGQRYCGSFINGMKHGFGKWWSTDQNQSRSNNDKANSINSNNINSNANTGNYQSYEGEWKFNKPQGDGTIISQLSEYTGQVKNGYKHGIGSQLFKNGDRYQGHYSNGKPQGQGSYYWMNGSMYTGEFKNGLRYGYGTWKYHDQSYIGSYVNDKRNGQGTYIWKGGSCYKGEFVDDLRHGRGQMTWGQGQMYRGEWKEGKQEGQGEVWEHGKIVQKGIYQNGRLKINALSQLNQRKLIPIQPANAQKKSISRFSNQTHKESKYPSIEIAENKANLVQRAPSNTTSFNLPPSTKAQSNAPSNLAIHKHTQLFKSKQKSAKNRYSVIQNHNAHNGNLQKMEMKMKMTTKSKKFHLQPVINHSNQKEPQNALILPRARRSLSKQKLSNASKPKKVSASFQKEITADKFQQAFQNQRIMFQTQLTPIKWKNFKRIAI